MPLPAVELKLRHSVQVISGHLYKITQKSQHFVIVLTGTVLQNVPLKSSMLLVPKLTVEFKVIV